MAPIWVYLATTPTTPSSSTVTDSTAVGKRDLYDGGIKTPFIARWTGTIAPGQVNDTHFGDFADFLPTVAELAGADAPIGIDGESFAHVLTGTNDVDRLRARLSVL